MGLLEKLKNTFFEEEYVEVEEKKKESKPIVKKVETKPKKEEKQLEVIEIKEEPEVEVQEKVAAPELFADKELLKTSTGIQYFEDDDFVDNRQYELPVEKVKLYGQDPDELYDTISYNPNSNIEPYSNPEAKTGFKPTPIISPIYGILDKNYRKEEVVDKRDKPSSYVSRKHADLDFVRNKAFGNLEENIMDNTLTNITIIPDEEEVVVDENLLYDMTDSDGAPAVEKVTIADAEEYFEDLGLEYNVDYKDIRYEKATGRRSAKPVSQEEIIVEDKVEDEVQSDDNLFDLIDSMYEDKE